MSKNYIVNCYTCQHNRQETCKGCDTFLNGKGESYQNWKLREDLEQKDKKIAELEKALELACKHIENFSDGCYYCPKNQYDTGNCELESGSDKCIEWLKDYFKSKAREELNNDR